MKKFLMVLGAITMSLPLALCGMAQEASETDRPLLVQGIDLRKAPPKGNMALVSQLREGTILEPGTELVYDGDFTLDMIENWTGEGKNRAALVFQWNNGKDNAALVFGYRWDGAATGYDMLKAITENNPRLVTLCEMTGVGCEISPVAPNGYTLAGVGWDENSDGNTGINNGTNFLSNETGYYDHPSDYANTGKTDYDYDDWVADNSDMIWQAGWFKGYWSYWCKDSSDDEFAYSNWGMACRPLVDGSWDGWNYQANYNSFPWKPFVAAPSNIPEDAKTEFVVDGISYKLKDWGKKTVTVTASASGAYTQSEITIPATFVDEDITYTVVGVDSHAFMSAQATIITLPASVTSLG